MSTSKKLNLGPIKKVKPVRGVPTAAKIVNEYIIPKTPLDVASYAIGGPVTRAVAGISKKGAKFVSRVYKNIGNWCLKK